MLKNNVILILNQDDYYITEKYNGLDELELSISVNDAYYPQITEEASIIESQRYIIKAIDANTTSATIKCQIDLDDLKSNLYIGYTNYSDTCHNTIHNVLPSGWTVIDLSQSTIRRTVTADAATPLDIINACLDIYGVTVIRAGIIQSNDGRVYINLDTGDARFETSGGESMFDAAKDEILEEIADEYETKSDSDAQFAEIRKYIRFEGGNIILGSSGNELILKIQNDKIVFLENEQEIAYWQNRKFYAVDGEFINSLRLGKFAFLPRANGNLSFKRVAD